MNYPAQPQHPPVANHLVWAILSTLFCCLPFGIVSIVYASKVDGLRMSGNLPGAIEMSEKARKWALLATLSPFIGLVLWVVFFGGLAVLGGLAAGL